jgi:Rab-GTPase-TBC domain
MEENADIIKVDVQRSYLNIQNITHINSINFIESMRIVLLVYSFYDQTVGYCQGMNYIVGFLLNVFPQEGEAFYALRQLMELSKMRCLFKKETPLLQQLFYIIKKLIAKHMPELYRHMDSEGVEVSFFAASWIVTLFSNALQYPKVDTIPPLLLFIWEQFISHGWKSIAKIIITLLKYYESNLISLKFDKIIMNLNEKCADLVLTFDNKIVEQIVNTYSTIKIKGVDMYTLEFEYKSISGIAEAESPARQKVDLNKGDLLIEL